MSRFVSGGNVDEPIERDDAWLKVQQELEEKRRKKEEEGRQEGGKSLYETLQANKAAKQDAFEEANRLKNQFRALDDDEIGFLDEVLEASRARDAAVRRETAEQLELFRQQQEKTERVALGDATEDKDGDEQSWVVAGKKRKRAKDKGVLPGVKLRKASSNAEGPVSFAQGEQSPAKDVQPVKAHVKPTERTDDTTSRSPVASTPGKPVVPTSGREMALSETKATSGSVPPATGLGLGGYSSDEN